MGLTRSLSLQGLNYFGRVRKILPNDNRKEFEASVPQGHIAGINCSLSTIAVQRDNHLPIAHLRR